MVTKAFNLLANSALAPGGPGPSLSLTRGGATALPEIYRPALKAPDSAPAIESMPDTAPPPAPGRSSWKRTALIAGGALLLLACGIGAYQWYGFASTHEETDDAYTVSHVHAVSPRISDTVLKVLVDDNQHVKAGQVLVQLDPNDFQVKVQQAQAALELAKNQAIAARTAIGVAGNNASGKSAEAAGSISNAVANIARSQAAVAEAKAAIPQAQAELAQKQAEEVRAANDYKRYQLLAAQGAVAMQQRDNAWRDYQVAQQATRAAQDGVTQAQARLAQAQQGVLQAQGQLQQSRGMIDEAKALQDQTQASADQFKVAQASVDQAQAQLADAQLQLSYTNVVAPVDGRVGKKLVEEGQRVQPGQELMDIVSDDTWVVANFKETQLERMRQGEKVEVSIDSFPHHKFTGVVDSVSPGSGATFALLPPENATGNFTKIVQRVPVKIVLDRSSTAGFEQLLVPGMSAVVTVNTGK